MPKDQFAHEMPLVAHLLDRLGIKTDVPLTNPNTTGESGADVLAIIAARHIGIQVTQIDNAYSLPGVTLAPIQGRGAEKKLAGALGSAPYGGFAENDPAKIVANVKRAVQVKSLHRVSGFDELWLLVAAGVPENGAVLSTFAMTPFVSTAALSDATSGLLAQSSYDRAFLLPVLGVERAAYQWAKRSGSWTKHVETEAAPSLTFDELMARAREAERSGDVDAWTDREVTKMLVEMRSAHGER
jgi:hypothetical protein